MKLTIQNVFILSISVCISFALSLVPRKLAHVQSNKRSDTNLNPRSGHSYSYPTSGSALLKTYMSKFDSIDGSADYTDNNDDSEKDMESGWSCDILYRQLLLLILFHYLPYVIIEL